MLNTSISSNAITSEKLFNNRRDFLKKLALLYPTLYPSSFLLGDDKLAYAKDKNSLGLKLNSYEQITTYNNFYELSYDKSGPAKNAHRLKTRPWSIKVDGLVQKPLTVGIEDILSKYPLQERIYRFRCVETWSMVVPWIGFELSHIIKKASPLSKAKYVRFETIYDPEMLPNQKKKLFGGIDYPYVEGLRLDEAMHPLSILSVGLYGKVLPNQNGAPIRLIVPWKYGFKSIKSIVKITLTDKPILNTWQKQAPSEYGFYANVNPAVDHPRWSQKRERVLGSFFSTPTLPFNGYADEVAHLYKGMNLKKYY